MSKSVSEISHNLTAGKVEIRLLNVRYKYIQRYHAPEVIENQTVDFFSNISLVVKSKLKWTDVSFAKNEHAAYLRLKKGYQFLVSVIFLIRKILDKTEVKLYKKGVS